MSGERQQACFLLIKTPGNGFELARGIAGSQEVAWVSPAYGPHSVIAYAQKTTAGALARFVEGVRTQSGISELDARMCKHIPGDEALEPLRLSQPEVAVLLINVNYKEEKERIVTYNLRKNPRVALARAMWGPADIIAVVEAEDHEAMRNLICDEIKVMKGIASNTTLYCYPQG